MFDSSVCPLLAFAAEPARPFELRDGDRVVFLGDTLIGAGEGFWLHRADDDAAQREKWSVDCTMS